MPPSVAAQEPKRVAVFVDLENMLGTRKKSEKRDRILTEILKAVTQCGLKPLAPLLRTYASKRKLTVPDCKAITDAIQTCGFTMRWASGIADDLLIADIQDALKARSCDALPEVVVIVSSDTDFSKIARTVRNQKREVWVISNKTQESRLGKVANRCFVIKSTTITEIHRVSKQIKVLSKKVHKGKKKKPATRHQAPEIVVEPNKEIRAWQMTITPLRLEGNGTEAIPYSFFVSGHYSREWLTDWAQSRLGVFGQIEIIGPIQTLVRQIWTLKEICSSLRENL